MISNLFVFWEVNIDHELFLLKIQFLNVLNYQ